MIITYISGGSMKKIVGLFSLVLSSLVVMSCASPPPTPEPAPVNQSTPAPTPEPTPIAEELAPVYDEYQGDLILDGATNYVVKLDDTLSEISSSLYGYGRGIYFPIIMLASRTIVRDPDLIEPGMNLTVPDLQRNLDNSDTRERIKSYLLEIAAVYDRRARPGYSFELQNAANSAPITLQR
jgi:hypothetical protein